MFVHPFLTDERMAAGDTRLELNIESTFWTRQDGQLCLQNFRPERDLLLEPHTYSEYTIVTCLQGEILKSQLGRTQVIGPGETVVGNHGVEHTSGYRSGNGARCQAVVLSVDRRVLATLAAEFDLPRVDAAASPAFLGKVQSAALYDCARVIAGELKGGLAGHRIIVESMANRLLVETLRAWPRSGIEMLPADLSPRLPRRDFVRAYEFMRWCRKDNFRLQNLCQLLGSSEERFNRLFFASTRHTPAKFYNWLLLDRARDLLRDPGCSIKEAGYQLGFKTCSHFIAAFRREFGLTPQEFRKHDGLIKLGLQLS